MEDWQYKPARDFGLAPKEGLRSLSRESGLASTLAQRGWWGLVRTYLTLYHRLRVHGREHLPATPPYVLVANHTSHLDALVLAAALPRRLRTRVFPIAAGDTFFETPGRMAFAALLLNALPMWRRNCGRHALKNLRDRLLEDQCIYIIFPEGTRSRDGSLARFKPGLGMILAGTSVPIVPCHLTGAFEAYGPGSKVPKPRSITLSIGDPLCIEDASNDREGWNAIGEALHLRVSALGG